MKQSIEYLLILIALFFITYPFITTPRTGVSSKGKKFTKIPTEILYQDLVFFPHQADLDILPELMKKEAVSLMDSEEFKNFVSRSPVPEGLKKRIQKIDSYCRYAMEGEILRKQGKFKQAIPWFQKGLKLALNKKTPDLEYTNLFSSLLNKIYDQQYEGLSPKERKARIGTLFNQVSTDGSVGTAMFLRLFAEFPVSQGNLGRAERMFSLANKLDTGLEISRIAGHSEEMADLYMRYGHHKEAEVIYTAILKDLTYYNVPASSGLLFKLGKLKESQGQYSPAEQFYLQGINVMETTEGQAVNVRIEAFKQLLNLYQKMKQTQAIWKTEQKIRDLKSGKAATTEADQINISIELELENGK